MTAVTASAALLAHQGGWDEILLIAAPILVIVAALALVKKRVDRATQARAASADLPSSAKEPTESETKPPG